jgi:hypothetical protein
MNASDDLRRFLNGQLSAAEFPHREHVRMAFELLGRHEFAEATLHYSNALRVITSNAGHPEAFNLTITVAFLALIAERMAAGSAQDFEGFARAHPDLFDKGLLARWYRPEQLASALAHRTFLLPDPRA